MTLIARLCALCAMCALMQTAMPEEGRASLRMMGGLLMLHLVISGIQELCRQVIASGDLVRIFDVLMK